MYIYIYIHTADRRTRTQALDVNRNGYLSEAELLVALEMKHDGV